MNYNSRFKEKLSKLLFLEVHRDGFLKSIGVQKKISFKNNDLYIPISIDYVSSNIKDEYKLENLPIYYFVEGMFFSLGADEGFRFNDDYIILLKEIKDSIPCIKKIIADKVKNNNLEDAFVLLRGLGRVCEEKEFYEKILMIGEAIRQRDNNFGEVQKTEIEVCKKIFYNEAFPYYYSAIIYEAEGEIAKAFAEINEYIARGGAKNELIESFYQRLENEVDYQKGKELLIDEPREALKKLLPLIEKFNEDPILYYYIAVAYRKIENYEKAIYYLNDSLALDDAIVETVNELGINYACIGDYENAIKHFRKAFEATKDIEICTNLIMCYININDIKNAKLHLNIAQKINSDDEIVKKLTSYLEGDGNGN